MAAGEGNGLRLTVEEAAAAIAARVPALAERSVRPLGEGLDHWAFDVGGTHVFRFPKEAESAARLAVEARLLRWLAPQLPLRVPEPTLFGASGSPLSRPFAGYPRLEGAPALEVPLDGVSREAVGRDVGRFLQRLHAVDLDEAGARGLWVEAPEDLGEWREEALADLEACYARGHVDAARATSWARLLEAAPDAQGVALRVLHGDLAAEHVLLDTAGRVSGVIDWSDAVLGDPARDLAGLVHWGGATLLSACLGTYGEVERGTLERARWFAACRAVADIAFGETHGRPAYIEGGLRALAHVEAFGRELR